MPTQASHCHRLPPSATLAHACALTNTTKRAAALCLAAPRHTRRPDLMTPSYQTQHNHHSHHPRSWVRTKRILQIKQLLLVARQLERHTHTHARGHDHHRIKNWRTSSTPIITPANNASSRKKNVHAAHITTVRVGSIGMDEWMGPLLNCLELITMFKFRRVCVLTAWQKILSSWRPPRGILFRCSSAGSAFSG